MSCDFSALIRDSHGISREWIATVPTWPSNFKYRDMTEVGMELSKRLRDPNGEHRCDIVLALTHARLVVLLFLSLLRAERH